MKLGKMLLIKLVSDYSLGNSLSTGLLVPYREILNPRFLPTDLASSVRPGGSLQLRLHGGVRPHYWKIDRSAD